MTPRVPPSHRPFVAICAFLSGIAATAGLIFLFIFYSDINSLGHFGTFNDIAVAVQYTLMLPIAVFLYQLLRPVNPRRARNNLIIGLAGMLAVIILQLLLILNVIPFYVQIGPVIICFLIVLAWFLLNRDLGRDTGIFPQNLALTILAGLVFGYPIWSYKLGRNLLR
jgi:hypothetical protein